MLELAFYTKKTNGVGDDINVLLFPELSPSTGSKASLLIRRWDTVLGYNTSTSFADTGTLLGKNKVVPIRIFDAAWNQIEACTVLCTVFLGDSSAHLATQELK